MLKNFDIKNSAQGVDKEVVKEFEANVMTKILMIGFFGLGKEQQLPQREEYMVLSYQLSLWKLVIVLAIENLFVVQFFPYSD